MLQSGSIQASAVGAERFCQLSAQLQFDDQWHEVATDEQANGAFTAHWHEPDGDTPILTIQANDSDSFRVQRVRVAVTLPLRNYARVIIPDCGRHYVNSTKALDIRAGLSRIVAPNAGHPFFALTDEMGDFLFGFGLLNAPGEVEIRRLLPVISNRRAMVGGDEVLTLQFEWAPANGTPGEYAIQLFKNQSSNTWFDALRSYTDLIKQREEIIYPRNPDAWNPVWCTWTAFPSADMNDQTVLENARMARELGMTTIILDDGWFGPGLDDDHHGDINHGDYEPDPRKFDDLPALIKKVQALGMKFLLWHAPLCVAPESKAKNKLDRWLIRCGDKNEQFLSVNGMHQLCPACPEVRQYVADETKRLLQTYGADGLKVDLFNCLPDQHCTCTDHEHDIDDPVIALDALMQTQWEAAREVNPNVLIELKQDYGNVRLIRHGTMVRAGDTAYDMDTNLHRCGYTQAFANCLHVDPLVTSIHTPPVAIALMMIKALVGGVPTFSMNLPNFSEEQREVIGAWLGLYNEQRHLFEQPRQATDNYLQTWRGGTNNTAWAAALFQAQQIALPDVSQVLLFNGTGKDTLRLQIDSPVKVSWTTYDYTLRQSDNTQTAQWADTTCISVPAGGMARIDRI